MPISKFCTGGNNAERRTCYFSTFLQVLIFQRSRISVGAFVLGNVDEGIEKR